MPGAVSNSDRADSDCGSPRDPVPSSNGYIGPSRAAARNDWVRRASDVAERTKSATYRTIRPTLSAQSPNFGQSRALGGPSGRLCPRGGSNSDKVEEMNSYPRDFVPAGRAAPVHPERMGPFADERRARWITGDETTIRWIRIPWVNRDRVGHRKP